ncbi:MAG: Adaptive-response sensory-kinase SasA [Gammaproteobacteria bacterium]|nr:Adaptive-response sensory-kinase SasA [Gammaproteobacteria bacterium]
MSRHTRIGAFVLALSVILLVSLVMMSEAMQNRTRFSHIYSLLLVVNALGLLGFLALIVANLRRLIRELRQERAGARLKRRLTLLFVLLSTIPVLTVYGFSLEFLRRGIDNWFDVRVSSALEDALNLSRASLDMRMRELLRQTSQLAESITDSEDGADPLRFEQLQLPESLVVENPFSPGTVNLQELLHRSGAEELTLMTAKGAVLEHSSFATDIVPSMPPEAVLLQLRQNQNYIALEPIRDSGLAIRVVVNVPSSTGGEGRVLQALYPIAERMRTLADNVQSAFIQYKELAYLRDRLKVSFMMTLTLVLLFSIFTAVWAAFYTAQRLSDPIHALAEGTKAVAAGNYDTRLPVPGADDIGVLVHSFNEMTRRLAEARNEAERSRDEVERQRAYLETVLGRLSSGVLTVSSNGELLTANATAAQILGLTPGSLPPTTLPSLIQSHAHLEPFLDSVRGHLRQGRGDWQEEVTVFGPGGRKVIMCRGARLDASAEGEADHVIVFDDVTALIQGQRDAAWSEVARRLAHEIKNPLTPIQLSAERLRHKYLRTLDPEESEVLDRLTNTIIQQVETMKGMVNTFSEYARSPRIQQEPIQLNHIIESVVDLYRSDEKGVRIETDLAADIPTMHADPNRLRQLLNNLISNAFEAQSEKAECYMRISTRMHEEAHGTSVEMRVEDHGNGIAPGLLNEIFEPYVTTKPRGTGLGLAIVKKIVEEHGGTVWMENSSGGGACASVRLPVTAPEHAPAPYSRNQASFHGRVA